jgi:hypothetical protein
MDALAGASGMFPPLSGGLIPRLGEEGSIGTFSAQTVGDGVEIVTYRPA